MDANQHIQLAERYGAHNYHPLPVVIASGQGPWVVDVEGRRYLDMLSAYSALNFGYSHPSLIAAAKRQLDRCTLTSRAFHNDQLGPFCKELTDLSGMEVVLPMNTGAEAVETALKTARKWGYFKKGIPADKAEIVVCQDNFHGRTVTIVGFSSDAQYREGFGPFTPGFAAIPFNDTAALERAITPNTAAFLVEPIQAESGILVPSPGYLAKVREICTRHNVLLMTDEIQTGLARTGKMFAFEHDGIRPDVLILGKALGGGVVPISAVLASREVMSVFKPGDHGSTFGGNPLACAVAREAIRLLREEKLHQRAAELGEYAMGRLRQMKASCVREIRGRGLLIGIDLQRGGPAARHYCEKLMAGGMLCKETHEWVIRLAPALTIEKNDLDWALDLFTSVLK